MKVDYSILQAELIWLQRVIQTRVELYFNQESQYSEIEEIVPIDISSEINSPYATVVKDLQLNFYERIVFILSLVPHLAPQILDLFFLKNKITDKCYSEFGGWIGKSHGGFLPTGETAAFIISGGDLKKRMDVLNLFDHKSKFIQNNVLSLENDVNGEPFFSRRLTISTDYLNRATTGEFHKPDFSMEFPAKLLHTDMDWDDLVLPKQVLKDIDLLITRIVRADEINNLTNSCKKVKPGYRCLFYGSSGTGKTLTASLIGKRCGLDVYRIDLSMIISKYIGETEKNLRNIFDQAEHKNWILFFDEADALFGQRSSTNSSNDRYANQEVSYLLQRIEDFSGIIILATNLKSNLDDAFWRRFQLVINFPIPDASLRLRLWNKSFSEGLFCDQSIDFSPLAYNYELSGGAIINVLSYCVLKLLSHPNKKITLKLIKEGVKKEIVKQDKLIRL
ncbi:ATP-binding protein [Halosquirtibacter laminarini]|uniref:ATP-binding protein n=1 Tax=Halosquirtibacter laminarini TaxID=3374600 RepID=A0AC61NFI0_9BACT|nr:ATP-binding protein [Prolixibacteraceae bacterium]